MNKRWAGLISGLIAVNVMAQQNQITVVSPNTGGAGASGLLVTFTLDSDLPQPPPSGIMPASVTMGSLSGTSITHDSQYSVTAVFDIPANEENGAKDCTVTFSTPNGDVPFVAVGGFTVTGGTRPEVGGTVTNQQPAATSYPIVDTAQINFYDASSEISAPVTNAAFYGQDGQYVGRQPDYTISADGKTVYDNVTGLTWTRSHDWDGDGDLDVDDKMTQANAAAFAATLNAQSYGGYSDWRLPSTKEIYSLMNFNGTDPDPTATDSSGLTPFIDDSVFEIGFGDVDAGERIIDSQFATTTIYVDYVFETQEAIFGLNLIDGRIKGYPTQTGKTYYAYYCRGNADYGINDFEDNSNGTVTDHATGLMWAQADSGIGFDWEGALAYAETNELAGHTDWRLPNAKELQSLLDYSRSPSTTGSAAIDPIFACTQIINLAGDVDFPWYWSGTTHLKYTGSAESGVYVCFGRGMGSMDMVNAIDVHGAGCQRSDPKSGNPADFPAINANSPQGDVQRVFNHVRLVRDADLTVPAEPSVYYVDANTASVPGEQDGISWDTAFEDLQDALAVATTQEIWVAEGIYYPDEAAAGYATVTDNDSSSYFQLPVTGAIYGGFSGTETNRNARDVDANKTVLSGDIDQNDTTDSFGVLSTPDGNIYGTNALVVVIGPWGLTSLLDGVTITGGDGGEGGAIVGGGTYRQCTIQGNYGYYCGGRYGEGDPLALIECDFINNVGRTIGAVDASGAEDVTIESCRFVGNRSMRNQSHSAGALVLGYQDIGLTNCLFSGNSGELAGGIRFRSSGSLQLVNCTIADNTASDTNANYTGAGGVAADTNVAVSVYNSIIWGNSAPENDNAAGIDVQSFSLIGGTHPQFSDDDYHLSFSSPCINAGTNAVVTASEDLDGNARIYDGTVDMGCYETYDDGSDADSDTLTDYEEGVHYGSDPELTDTDGDGSSDGDEAFIGSDLTDEDSVFLISIQETGTDEMIVSWPTFTSGRFYELWGSTNLVDGEWFYLGGTSSSNLTDSVTHNQAFLRVEVIDSASMF